VLRDTLCVAENTAAMEKHLVQSLCDQVRACERTGMSDTTVRVSALRCGKASLRVPLRR
jgi:hypothetical protein